MQTPLELRIVHPRLPGQQRQRLARAEHGGELVVRHFCGIGIHPLRVVKGQLHHVCLRHREDVRNIELVRRSDLDAHRPGQDDAAKTLRRFGRHFSGDPASDRAADKVDAVEFQDVHQFEIKMGNVVNTVEPIRQARLAEAWMRRRDEAALLGQRRHERLLRSKAAAAVQKQNGTRRPLGRHRVIQARRLRLSALSIAREYLPWRCPLQTRQWRDRLMAQALHIDIAKGMPPRE